MGCAQTGTGKTAAFTLPILQLLAAEPRTKGRRTIKALVLTPTRELAAQIDECCRDYARYTDIRHCVIFGGVNQRPQVDALQRGIDLLVATPGRLLDLIGQGYVSLADIRFFVLDEADRCSTWVSSTTSGESSRCCPASGKRSSSRRRCPTTS